MVETTGSLTYIVALGIQSDVSQTQFGREKRGVQLGKGGLVLKGNFR
jgi:hypothetical protein